LATVALDRRSFAKAVAKVALPFIFPTQYLIIIYLCGKIFSFFRKIIAKKFYSGPGAF
jgi:hypothetical protein